MKGAMLLSWQLDMDVRGQIPQTPKAKHMVLYRLVSVLSYTRKTRYCLIYIQVHMIKAPMINNSCLIEGFQTFIFQIGSV